MRILIIRHADPDYEIDGLTDVGKIEAELLSQKLCKEKIDKIYCSPLGRAKLTAKPTADKLCMDVEICDFLREFSYAEIERFDDNPDKIAWDLLPEFVLESPMLYDTKKWRELDFVKKYDMPKYYDKVCKDFDDILEKHGYKREKAVYKVEKPNHDTIAFFCHYGLSCVLLSHIANCSPYSFWQNFAMPPSSVTVIHTEERREGIASLRTQCYGDTSHLYIADRKPSFSARFCECFKDNTRHD